MMIDLVSQSIIYWKTFTEKMFKCLMNMSVANKLCKSI